MKKDPDYNIQFLPPMHYGSKLGTTPTVRDVIQAHEEIAGWIKSKEPQKKPFTPLRYLGWILTIMWVSPLVTYLEYMVLKMVLPQLFQ